MFPVTDNILVFTILIFCILLAPLLSARLRIPDLIFLLAFGIVLGPNSFNIIERNTAVTLLGEVGLLYIMFLAGLEIDLYHFRRSYKRSVAFGLLTFAVPQVLGTLAGRFILGLNWSASLLLASMFASHTLLAYPQASNLGITRTEPVTITVAATIITDTLALLVLAIVADHARGIELTVGFWLTIVVGISVLTATVWKGVPYLARWFFQRVTGKSNAQFLFVIAVICLFSYLSHFAKMEPIIGAFLVGATFNRLIPEHSSLMNHVKFAGNTLFIPFFLISVGMLVDPMVMFTGPRSWAVGITMVVAVIVTKFLASQAIRAMFGYSRSAGFVMFGLSVVQAAATLAAVMVGYRLEIFDEAVLNGTILMILVTCPLGSWLVDRYGRRMVVETPPRPASTRSEQRLMVAVSSPQSAARLMDLAFMLRSEERPGGIYPLAIALERGNTELAVEEREVLLGKCVAQATSAGMTVNPELRVDVNVSDGIIRGARELRSTAALVGWHSGQSTSIRIFGTVMRNLVEHALPRLIFCRLVTPLNTTKRILIPFPPLATRRRDIAALVKDTKVLCKSIGAELHIFTIAAQLDELSEMAEQTKPSCPVHTSAEPDWNAVRKELMSSISADDLVLLPVDRRSGVMWTPGLDHLPEQIAGRYPQINLIVDYPSLPRLDQQSSVDSQEPDPLFPEMIPFDLNSRDTLDVALEKLAQKAFPRDPVSVRATVKMLRNSANSYPVELAPGIVLLHARHGDIQRPLMMICHSVEGWELPDLPESSHIIMILLGGDSHLPEQHLKILSLVANRMLNSVGTIALEEIQSAKEVCLKLEKE